MKKRVVLIFVFLCTTGFISLFAQYNDPPMKEQDTARQDNTRLVQENYIPDTTKDSTSRKNSSGKKQKMYLVPDKEKKKTTR